MWYIYINRSHSCDGISTDVLTVCIVISLRFIMGFLPNCELNWTKLQTNDIIARSTASHQYRHGEGGKTEFKKDLTWSWWRRMKWLKWNLGCLCSRKHSNIESICLWWKNVLSVCQRFEKRLQKAEGGRRERERLWLLDLFLWLHHVVVEGSKGDDFFFFFIQPSDSVKTPATLPDRRHFKQENRKEGWGKVWWQHGVFNARIICVDTVKNYFYLLQPLLP